jgi:hypothetical protein
VEQESSGRSVVTTQLTVEQLRPAVTASFTKAPLTGDGTLLLKLTPR